MRGIINRTLPAEINNWKQLSDYLRVALKANLLFSKFILFALQTLVNT